MHLYVYLFCLKQLIMVETCGKMFVIKAVGNFLCKKFFIVFSTINFFF